MVNKTARLRENEEFVITPALLIGRILTFYRFKAGVSQKELGKQLKVAQRTISSFENTGMTQRILKNKNNLHAFDKQLNLKKGTILNLYLYLTELKILPLKISSRELFSIIENVHNYKNNPEKDLIHREMLVQVLELTNSLALSKSIHIRLSSWIKRRLEYNRTLRKHRCYFTESKRHVLETNLNFVDNLMTFKILTNDGELIVEFIKEFCLNSVLKINHFNNYLGV